MKFSKVDNPIHQQIQHDTAQIEIAQKELELLRQVLELTLIEDEFREQVQQEIYEYEDHIKSCERKSQQVERARSRSSSSELKISFEFNQRGDNLMKTQYTFQVKYPSGHSWHFTLEADFDQSSSPIWVEHKTGWHSTPYQVANASHDPLEAAYLVYEPQDVDEKYTIELIDEMEVW